MFWINLTKVIQSGYALCACIYSMCNCLLLYFSHGPLSCLHDILSMVACALFASAKICIWRLPFPSKHWKSDQTNKKMLSSLRLSFRKLICKCVSAVCTFIHILYNICDCLHKKTRNKNIKWSIWWQNGVERKSNRNWLSGKTIFITQYRFRFFPSKYQ